MIPDAVPESHEAVMSPQDALARIREGKPLGRVKVERLVLTGEFTQPVDLSNATLVRLRVEQATFRAPVNCKHTTLAGARFENAVVFEKGFSLFGADLSGGVQSGITVKGNFQCDNLKTHGPLKFVDCQFDQVRFWEAKFDGWLDFAKCIFHGEADFRSLHVREGGSFDHCTFHGNALFRGATFEKKLDFDSSRFEQCLDLSKAKLHDFVYLESIEQGPNQTFAFRNAVAEHLLVRPDQVTGRLTAENQKNYPDAKQEYGLLKRNFELQNRHEEEDWAFHQFKINCRRAVSRSWLKPWTKLGQFTEWFILDLGCAYGTNPWRTVRTALVAMGLFALIYIAGMGQIDTAYRAFEDQAATSWPNRIVSGLAISVSTFTTGMSGEFLQMAKGWILLPMALEALFGTLLWGLFIVSFSRKVIR